MSLSEIRFIGMSRLQQIKLQTRLLLFVGLHYIYTLKRELSGTKAYEQTSKNEKYVINNHILPPALP